MAKILIIDDEPEVGELCASVLTAERYDADWTVEGKEALQMVEKEAYDLAIVDLVMPGIDGLDIVQSLRTRFPDMGIIVFTGFASVDIAVKAMKSGADDFLTKPVWNDRLCESVSSVLATRSFKNAAKKPTLNKPEKQKTSRNYRLLHGFSKKEAEEFIALGHKEYFNENTRINISQNDETVIVLHGEGMLWSGDAPMCRIGSGDSVGEAKVFLPNNGYNPMYLEVDPGTEILRINKDDLVAFFKDKTEKLMMLFAINVVNSQSLKLCHTFEAFGKFYRKLHLTAA